MSILYPVLPDTLTPLKAIGNEVAAKGHENTAADYVKAAKTVEQIVTDALNLTGDSGKIFEVLDLASDQVVNQSPWTL